MIGSSGDAVGANPSSEVSQGASAQLPLLRPQRPAARGLALHPPRPRLPRRRRHGLFGALDVEPAGSTYLDVEHRQAARQSGWEAIIVPPTATRPSASTCRSTTRSATRSSTSATRTATTLPHVDPHHRRPTAPARARSTTAPSRSCTGWSCAPQQEVARLQLLHVRRPRDADAARLPGRPDQDPHHPRRQRDVPRLPPARRRHPLALQPRRPTTT